MKMAAAARLNRACRSLIPGILSGTRRGREWRVRSRRCARRGIMGDGRTKASFRILGSNRRGCVAGALSAVIWPCVLETRGDRDSRVLRAYVPLAWLAGDAPNIISAPLRWYAKLGISPPDELSLPTSLDGKDWTRYP
jgi:hypothetical protein